MGQQYELVYFRGEDGESFFPFISPERPYSRPPNFTSPSPDSNLSELINSTSQGLNASIELNPSDEEKINFDSLLARERYNNNLHIKKELSY